MVAALCVALMIFYATTLPAKAANQIHHDPGLMIVHDHGSLDNLPIHAVQGSHAEHADQHEDVPHGDEEPSDPFASGHHHHGDNGPNMLAPDAVTSFAMQPPAGLHDIGKDRRIAGLQTVGPERPPRASLLIA